MMIHDWKSLVHFLPWRKYRLNFSYQNFIVEHLNERINRNRFHRWTCKLCFKFNNGSLSVYHIVDHITNVNNLIYCFCSSKVLIWYFLSLNALFSMSKTTPILNVMIGNGGGGGILVFVISFHPMNFSFSLFPYSDRKYYFAFSFWIDSWRNHELFTHNLQIQQLPCSFQWM